MTVVKHPGGRPTLYRREYCRRIVELMSEGRSLEGCAALLGVHPDTLTEWQKTVASDPWRAAPSLPDLT